MDDHDRFERLFREHVVAVRAYALRRDPTLAEDVVAETFAICWRRIADVPRDELPWLLGVARRTLANARRTRSRQAAVVDRVETEPPATRAPADGDPRVRPALARLSVRDQEILLLVAWDGLDRAGIARVLGCSQAVVRLRLHRARQRFAAAYTAIGSKPAQCAHDIEEGFSHV